MSDQVNKVNVQGPARPVRRRLEPSDKQLKQQQAKPSNVAKLTNSTTTIMAGLYDLEETLGKGHFAVVKAAKHVFTGERVAVKVIDKTKLDTVSQKALLKEVLCLKLVQHPNVVKLYEVIDTSTKMYLVLELGQGDLYDLILTHQGGFKEPEARELFIQILTAVSYCHKLHVAHRDLKPENVIYFPSPGSRLGSVKLTDFGFSNKFCPGVNLDTSCGSLAYSAPEILLGDSYDAPLVDIWSLGVILYMIVCGRAPFCEANDSETLIMIMDVKYSIPTHLSDALKHLISRMLVRDPNQRANLHEIESHEWVGGCKIPHNTPLIFNQQVSEVERDKIITEMVAGSVVSSAEDVITSLRSNAYNHVTSTYYLLAERLLRDKTKLDGVSLNVTPPAEIPCEIPTPRIRKNSHTLEDVVLPSTITSKRESSSNTSKQTRSVDVLDLHTSPAIPSSTTTRNTSPHHPHYYHHVGGKPSRVEAPNHSPPKFCSEYKITNEPPGSSDSSDEGSVHTPVTSHHHHLHNPSSVAVPVINVQEPEDEPEPETKSSSSGSEAQNNNLSIRDFDEDLPPDGGGGGNKKSKKKRVLFLSWFFKKSDKSSSSNSNKSGESSSRNIYKTKSCSELKSKSCNLDLHTHEVLALHQRK